MKGVILGPDKVKDDSYTSYNIYYIIITIIKDVQI